MDSELVPAEGSEGLVLISTAEPATFAADAEPYAGAFEVSTSDLLAALCTQVADLNLLKSQAAGFELVVKDVATASATAVFNLES